MKNPQAVTMLVAIILISFSPSPSASTALSLVIQSVTRIPPDPYPGARVTIFAQVCDRSYDVVKVELSVSVGRKIPNLATMQLVDGDKRDGTYSATIDGESLASQVSYSVLAYNSIGHMVNSELFTYTVARDLPPSIEFKIVNPNRPIAPWESVEATAFVEDRGSGIKNVTLSYSTDKPLLYENFPRTNIVTLPMRFRSGTKFSGLFECSIPRQPNGTWVYLEITAFDLADNQRQLWGSYLVNFPLSRLPYWNCDIDILDIVMQNITATIRISLQAEIPLEQEPKTITVFVSSSSWGGERGVTLGLTDRRYAYKGELIDSVGLRGEPRYFPLETYHVWFNFTLDVARFGFNGSNVESFYNYAGFSKPMYKPQWNDPDTSFAHGDKKGLCYLTASIKLTRRDQSIYTVLLPILTAVFVLGGTLLLGYRKEDLSNKLTVYLTLFVFIVGYFFNISSLIPFRLTYSIPELLLDLVMIGTATFMVLSVYLSRLPETSPDKGVKVDLVALFFTAAVFLGLFREGLTVLRPIAFWIVVGLVYGVTLKEIQQRKRKSLRVTLHEKDKRSLALVLAGSLLGLMASMVGHPFLLATTAIFGIVLLLYGIGIVQQLAHQGRLRGRWNEPLKIGILHDLGWNLANTQIYAWTDIDPSEWKSEIELQSKDRQPRLKLEFINIHSQFDSYVAILNPYGGVYPEADLKNLATLKKILVYVREGGLFVNVADIPTFWSYNPDLRRRLDTVETAYGQVQDESGVKIFSFKPFELTPLIKELGLRIASQPQGIQSNLDQILGITTESITSRRVAVADPNVTTCVNTTRLPYMDGSSYDMTPIFFVKYGEGDFLISLVWINDSDHDQTRKDIIKKTICKLTVDKLIERMKNSN